MDFYYTAGSAPCRSVVMAAKALGLELNKKPLNFLGGEHLKPEYLKINPQHTVPTIVDNGFTLWESRAIIIYLVEKYGKTDALYPKDPKTRGLIHQRLYFDMGLLYKSFSDYYYPQWKDKTPADPEKFKKLEEALILLNTFLDGHAFAAGDSFTIADIVLVTTITTYDAAGVDLSKHANVVRWYENAKKVTPGWAEDWAELLEIRKRMLNK